MEILHQQTEITQCKVNLKHPNRRRKMKMTIILPVIFTTALDVVERNVKRNEGSRDS
jgi:hypothetical protein